MEATDRQVRELPGQPAIEKGRGLPLDAVDGCDHVAASAQRPGALRFGQ